MKKTTCWILVLLFVSASVSWAQEGVAEGGDKLTFLDLIVQGGWAMIPLGLLSMGMIFFIVQNFLSLRKKTLLHTEMMPEFLDMMVKG